MRYKLSTEKEARIEQLEGVIFAAIQAEEPQNEEWHTELRALYKERFELRREQRIEWLQATLRKYRTYKMIEPKILSDELVQLLKERGDSK